MIDRSAVAELDSINTPLTGISLIEAAAGTGKTYNIQNLVARLVVEREFPIETIAVVTFTKAAAAELKERLHGVLSALADTLAGAELEDPVQAQRVQNLLDRFDSLKITRERQKELLDKALRDMDMANVSTIHGFCQKVLDENAFDSAVAFRSRVEENIESYISKLLGDFCRRERYAADPLPGADTIAPDTIFNDVKTLFSRNNLNIIAPEGGFLNRDELQAQIGDLLQQICETYDRDTYITPLNAILNAKARTDLETVDNELIKWPEVSQIDLPSLGKALYKLNYDFLKSQVNSRSEKYMAKFEAYWLEYGSFWEKICVKLGYLVAVQCPVYFLMAGTEFVRKGLEEWKRRDNFRGYDDLLTGVQTALAKPDGRLLPTLQKKFNAGIIDEFQDTDPVQYGIFSRIFTDRGPAADGNEAAFFMVGDPRQAIYTFRGGDLATYLKAAEECQRQGGRIFSLSTNFRSSARLIREVNEFFCTHHNTFAADNIPSADVKFPQPDPPGITDRDGNELQALQFYSMLDDNIDNVVIKCACQIFDILQNSQWQLPGKDKLQPGDIAVLSYDTYELEKMRDALNALGIPAIGGRPAGVWNSPAAEALATFLLAVLDHQNENLLKKAMLTIIADYAYTDLDVNSADVGERLLALRLAMIEFNQVWRTDGIAALMQNIFNYFGLKNRLARQPGGERLIANFTQLSDLLSQAERVNGLSPRSVLKYLQDKTASQSSTEEDELEARENDRSAVKLMTVHKAKGLQFPLVFLPGLNSWYPLKRAEVKLFHNPQGELCCEPTGEDQTMRHQAAVEELQEQLRLVYVAITRAEYMCVFYYGKRSKQGKHIKYTPLDWLIRMRNSDSSEDNFWNNDPPEISWPTLTYNVNIPPESRYTVQNDDLEHLSCPDADLAVTPHWRMISFSSLPLGEHQSAPAGAADRYDAGLDVDALDNDKNPPPAAGQKTASGGVWELPGGTAVGNAWHKILEELDFTVPPPEKSVSEIMRRFGFAAPKDTQATLSMLNTLLSRTLPCGLKLQDLPGSRRLNEFEFTLALPEGLALQNMLDAVAGYCAEVFGQTPDHNRNFAVSGGFFNGFIDMVFEYDQRYYIVDWKSNKLQSRIDAFTADGLNEAVFSSNYHMQYLCYTAALVRYLELRLGVKFDEALYDKYVGGVYYIFLRGITLGDDYGVFSTRVPWETVEALLQAFAAAPEAVRDTSHKKYAEPAPAPRRTAPPKPVLREEMPRTEEDLLRDLDELRSAARNGTVFNPAAVSMAELAHSLAGDAGSMELYAGVLLIVQSLFNGREYINIDDYAGKFMQVNDYKFYQFPDRENWLANLQNPSLSPVISWAARSSSDEQLPLSMVIGSAPGKLYLQRCWQWTNILQNYLDRQAGKIAPLPDLPAGCLANLVKYFAPAQQQPETDFQQWAVLNALQRKFTVISGGPGTGKTTVAAAVLAAKLTLNSQLKIKLAAPTGKASSRLLESLHKNLPSLNVAPEVKEVLQNLHSGTVHQLLGFRSSSTEFIHNRHNLLDCDLLLLDECSMMSLDLMSKVLEALPDNADLILLGDRRQLPSVEAGTVLADICDLALPNHGTPEAAEAFAAQTPWQIPAVTPEILDKYPLSGCVVELLQSHRFGAPGIAQAADWLRKFDPQKDDAGELADKLYTQELPGAVFAEVPTAELRQNLQTLLAEPRLAGGESLMDITRLCRSAQISDRKKAFELLESFRLLAPMHHSARGIESLNDMMLDLLHIRSRTAPGVPLMVTANDYKRNLYNGDIGLCCMDENKRIQVYFPHIPHGFDPSELAGCEVVWAMSVHKSQGSGFGETIFVMPDKPVAGMNFEMLYTAITRAENKLRCWGRKSVLAAALQEQ